MKILKSMIIFTSISLFLSGCSSPVLIDKKSKEKNNSSQTIKVNKSDNDFGNTDLGINTLDANSSVQISRYVTEKDTPTNAQINPLLAVSTFIFQASVVTVGDAVNQVLVTSGYQLAPHLNHTVKATLQQPLPITDRKLGPMPIQSALEVLMGEQVYRLEQDPLHRLVNFKVRASIKKALGENLNA